MIALSGSAGQAVRLTGALLVLAVSMAGESAHGAEPAIPEMAAPTAVAGTEPSAGTVSAEPAAVGELVPEAAPFHAVATLRNGAGAPFVVDLVEGGDPGARIAGPPSGTAIPPGGSITVAVAVPGTARSGPQSLRITVWSRDPSREPLDAELRWTVVPDVVVDGLPPGADPAQRPEDPGWRDLSVFRIGVRPDEPQRLFKRLRIAAPGSSGLDLGPVRYGGSLWRFTRRRLDATTWLLDATASSPDQLLVPGRYDEPVVIPTSHPREPELPLRFEVLVDPAAGRQ